MKVSDMPPGSVFSFFKEGLLGDFTTVAQGNTNAAHVAIKLPNGKMATTGAVLKVFYGEADIEKYCEGRTFDVLYPVDPFTPEQLTTLELCHQAMMKAPLKRLYGGLRYAQLYKAALRGSGRVTATDKTPPKPPQWFICSWAVGYCLWEMGCKVGKMFGKINYTGLMPEDFGNEADAVTDMLDSGQLQVVKHPCMYLRRVAHFEKYTGSVSSLFAGGKNEPQ